jgi:hypothetical protein
MPIFMPLPKYSVAIDDDDDDVYLDRVTRHKPKNYLPYVKYRPARKDISMKKKAYYPVYIEVRNTSITANECLNRKTHPHY